MESVRKKSTVYIEEDLLRAAKVLAARQGKKDYQILEEALRAHLGLELLQRIWARNDMGEAEATELAYDELREVRRQRGKRK